MRKILLLGTALLLFATTACRNLVEGFDKNPNVPTDISAAEELMVTVLMNDAFFHESQSARLSGIWAGYFTGSDRQFTAYEVYNVVASEFDSNWDIAYRQVLKQAKVMRAKAEEEGKTGIVAVSKIIEAHIMGSVAALWGDAPFSEAASDDFPTPKYDPQASIYQGVIALLDEAIATLGDASSAIPAAQDLFFAGDKSKWIAAANTLKARYYMHLKDYANAKSAALNGISSPAGDMMMPHGTTQDGNMNPYYEFVVNQRSGYMTAGTSTSGGYDYDGDNNPDAGSFVVWLMTERINNGIDDPERRDYYFDVSAGLASAELNTADDAAFAADASFPLVTYAENQLILAEAEMRTGTRAQAITYLNDYRANIDAYVGGGTYAPLAPATDADAMKAIMEEKYIAMVGQIEGFNDLRRWLNDNTVIGGSAVKDLAPNVPVKTPAAPTIPQRFLYPQVEVNTNPNVPEQSIDDLFTPTPVNAN